MNTWYTSTFSFILPLLLWPGFSLPFRNLSVYICIFMKIKAKKRICQTPLHSLHPPLSVLLPCWAVNEALLHLPPSILSVIALHSAAFAFPSTSCSLVLPLPVQLPHILFSLMLWWSRICAAPPPLPWQASCFSVLPAFSIVLTSAGTEFIFSQYLATCWGLDWVWEQGWEYTDIFAQ